MKFICLSVLISVFAFFASCKKDKKEETVAVIEHELVVESIIGTPAGSIDPARKGFINLYDGIAYDQPTAEANSSKVDVAYNYHGGGCSSCRFFENVTNMSTRTSYVDQFSTITNSVLSNAEDYSDVTPAMFNSIKYTKDIDTLFAQHDLEDDLDGFSDVTNRTTDVAVGKVFAFKDKAGRKGFFLISDYVANVPTGNRAELTLTIKIYP
jgi:hypothetical protein